MWRVVAYLTVGLVLGAVVVSQFLSHADAVSIRGISRWERAPRVAVSQNDRMISINLQTQLVAGVMSPAPMLPVRGVAGSLKLDDKEMRKAGALVPRQLFGGGVSFEPSDLPSSPLRTELESLTPKARAFALARLTKMSFHVIDLGSLHVDPSGMPYFVCSFSNTTEVSITQGGVTVARAVDTIPSGESDPVAGKAQGEASSPGILAPVSITNPPIRHSKAGATRILYLDFGGHVVTNTAWNTSYSVARWDCLPFDTDGTNSTFSDVEQGYIIKIWERVSEDYAPFDIDVTTEQPTNWTSTTGHALITPTTDANGTNCPHFGSGGIAYVGVFGDYNYSYNYGSCYSPAFVKPMSGSSYADTAEAVAHELGHNMGLSHDGFLVTPTTNAYYGGHGSGEISWGPIMGTGYGRNVSQWSKGEYYGANNPEDDLAIISAVAPYRADDFGGTNSTATLLALSNGTIIISSGIISSNTDVDVLAFAAGVGSISMTVFPYRCASGTYGGNLDVYARLYNSSGSLLASNDPTNTTSVILNYTAPAAGTYFLYISGSGTGNPTNTPPTGYTSYGSVGHYSVTGKVAQVPGLLVQTPNGGELWYKGQSNSIIWASSTNVTGPLKIELYRGGNPAGVITNSVTNSGAFAWSLTNTLIGTTNYQVRITSVVQTSVWDASDAPFAIATAPSSVLFQNFDAGASLPSNWTTTNLAGTTTWAFQAGGQSGGANPATAHSGTYNACLYDLSSSSDICRLSTPPLNMSGCTGAVLRFWHCMKAWPSDQDLLNIRVKTNAAASWLWVAGYSNSVDNWTLQTVVLPNPGANYTIAFEGDAKYGYGVCLDDVEVIGYPVEPTVATNNTPLLWLADNGLEPSDAGALSDTDNDGMKAWEEWIAGTSPTQKLSVLRVTNSWNALNKRIMTWPVVGGRIYSVSWSSNLVNAPFQSLVTSNTAGVYTDAVHAAERSGFYRIGVQISP